MGNNLLYLAESLRKKKASIEQRASFLAVKTAGNLLISLIAETPVDTSAALSNWVASLDTVPTNAIEAHFLGISGSTRAASGREAVSQAGNVLANKKPGQSIYVVNNIDYIGDLNKGSSRQAPAGFIEASIMQARKSIKNIKV